LELFLWGMAGALAPEVVRWFRIVKSGATPAEWRNGEYWAATACYVLLGGLLASLIAQPNGYAAFITGLTTEFAIMGTLSASTPRRAHPGGSAEELATRDAGAVEAVLVMLRRHAAYLRPDA